MSGVLAALAGSSREDRDDLTIGTSADKVNTYYGYSDGSLVATFGSMSDGVCALLADNYEVLYWTTPGQQLVLQVSNALTNAGWNQIDVNGTVFNRTDATYSTDSSTYGRWVWSSVASNPIGTSGTIEVVMT